MPDFDDMMNEVEHEIEKHDAEDRLDERLAALLKLNEQVENSTNNLANAMLQLEHAFQIYRIVETNLNDVVERISQKVDTINSHVDEAVKNLPNKLQIRIDLTDEGKSKVTNMFHEHLNQVNELHKKNIEEVERMLVAERKETQKRFKEYGGIYLGHYSQWVFMFFFFIGMFVFFGLCGTCLAKYNGW